MKLIKNLTGLVALFGMSSAFAGNVYLTGHDVLLHGGQQGYDVKILDYLADGTARADYNVAFITASVANPIGRWTTAGFATTEINLNTINNAAEFAAALVGVDAIAYAWAPAHTAADVAEFNSYSAEIASWFNDGGDIWANSSIFKPTYYDFLPPSAAASGPNLPGNPSTGFVATAEGIAQVGIEPQHINGDPTHNTFSSFVSAFTVMEIRPANNDAVVSIGLRDGTITDDGIVVDDTTTDDGTTMPVPEPGPLSLLGIGMLGLGLMRRRRQA